MPGRVERELRRVLVPQQLRRREPNRPRRRHFRPQIRTQRRRRRRLPRRDGRPPPRRPAGPGHRRGRRPLPPGPTPRAGPVLLPRRRREACKPFMEQSAHWFLDQHITDGQMDLVLDYASPVPAILTMKLMGLPYDNWHLYANLFHSVMAVPQDSDEYTNAIAKVPAMMQDVLEFAAARRADARRRPDQLPHSVRIRRPAPHRRTAAQHPLEPHRRRRRHHHLPDRADPAAPGHPPGPAATTHRPPGALPHRHRRIPALLLGQPNPEPHGHPRRRPRRPTPPKKRPRRHQLAGGQPRRKRIRPTRRSHSRSSTQPPRRLRARAAPLHRIASGAADVRGDGQGRPRPHPRLPGRPRRTSTNTWATRA